MSCVLSYEHFFHANIYNNRLRISLLARQFGRIRSCNNCESPISNWAIWAIEAISLRSCKVCLFLWHFCILAFLALLDYVSKAHKIEIFLTFWKTFFFFFFLRTFVFVNMGPYSSENFKTLLLLKIAAECSQSFFEFSTQWSSQKYCFGFLKF